MNKLELDLIDKVKGNYIIKYHTCRLDEYGTVILPISIYDWYNSAKLFEHESYTICNYEKNMDIIITKEMAPDYYKHPKRYRMKLEFNNNVLYISDSKFNNTNKSYCFQTFVDIRILDGASRLVFHDYRFLHNYDTRIKAKYYLNKFANNFSKFYKKYFIGCDVIYDSTLEALEVFHEDIMYEHGYIFKTNQPNETAIYTFRILSIEKG